MSPLWYSNDGDEGFVGNQEISIRDDGCTYLFNFMSKPPQCIANRGGQYPERNYWFNLVQSFGSEEKPFFDLDCDGTCLTWKTEYNSTYENTMFHLISQIERLSIYQLIHVISPY